MTERGSNEKVKRDDYDELTAEVQNCNWKVKYYRALLNDWTNKRQRAIASLMAATEEQDKWQHFESVHGAPIGSPGGDA